jgi:hypothetical protein
MRFAIDSRKLGRRLNFWAPSAGGYVYVDLNRQPGQLGRQPCEGGALMGETLWARDETQLERVCRRWYRAYTRARP